MKTLDISLDLETLSTRNDAALVSIGAACYIGDELRVFHNVLGFDPEGAEQTDAHVCRDTQQWWQSPEQAVAANHILDSLETDIAVDTRRQAIQNLRDWIVMAVVDDHQADKVALWGNGATFDISIIEYHFRQCGIKMPVPFYMYRDLRTRKEDAMMAGCEEFREPRELKHTAAADAVYQLRALRHYANFLTWGPSERGHVD